MQARRLLRDAENRLARGDVAGAAAVTDQMLAVCPGDPDALHLRGLAAACAGDLIPAAESLERAVRARRRNSQWLRDLGLVYSALHRRRDAARVLVRCASLAPGDPDCLVRAASAVLETDERARAVALCRRALVLNARSPDIGRMAARVFARVGRYREAMEILQACLAIAPRCARLHETLAEVCQLLRRYDDALLHARAAAALDPDNAQLRSLLAGAYWDTGRVTGALRALRAAVETEPDRPEIASAQINTLLHHPDHTGKRLLRRARAWAKTYANMPHMPPSRTDADPERTLRVGYLSGEFATVPAYFFLWPVFSAHDRRRFQITCYHARAASDDKTAELRRLADRWRDVSEKSDEDVADLVRRDRIDILVDCSGHYAYSRLLVFARKPAPVQVVLPNCPATTGLPEIDYILTDRWATPIGTEEEYSECVWRLNTGYIVYTPPEAPPVSPLPARETGVVTFGIFQRAAKLNSCVWEAVAKVLSAVPRSRLLLHNASSDLDAEGSTSRERVLSELSGRGIARERITFRGPRKQIAHLETLAQADIALDTFPYNGQTTTCECLWMGIPVVTLDGNSHVARVGRAILGRTGLDAWVARSVDEYVRIAASRASDLRRLAGLRSGLRRRVASSVLTDGSAVTRAIESGYRTMWRRWCAGKRPLPGRS